MQPRAGLEGSTDTTMRVADPASRDQDLRPWRGRRFAERVRRSWNQVDDDMLRHASDLEELATGIHAIVGGDRGHILDRLRLFQEMEENPARTDRLVRPGASAYDEPTRP